MVDESAATLTRAFWMDVPPSFRHVEPMKKGPSSGRLSHTRMPYVGPTIRA